MKTFSPQKGESQSDHYAVCRALTFGPLRNYMLTRATLRIGGLNVKTILEVADRTSAQFCAKRANQTAMESQSWSFTCTCHAQGAYGHTTEGDTVPSTAMSWPPSGFRRVAH